MASGARRLFVALTLIAVLAVACRAPDGSADPGGSPPASVSTEVPSPRPRDGEATHNGGAGGSVAPKVEASSTPEPTIPLPSSGVAPEDDSGIPTPEPTLTLPD